MAKAAGSIHLSLLDPTGGHMDDEPVLPGYDGLPFKGPVMPRKETDPLEVGTKVHIDILELSKKADLEQYKQICQLVGNGYAQISREDLQYDDKLKNWRVFIRWFEVFTYDPRKGKAHGPTG